MKKIKPQVAIVMGSQSDAEVMNEACEALDLMRVRYKMSVVSAHRTPREMVEFASSARKLGLRVIIAGAGGSAHLPGMIAALTELPVIGVPVPIGVRKGEDALWSIVQMPKGVPVATVAIGGAFNAGLLAAQIIAAGGTTPDGALLDRVADFKEALRIKVLGMGPKKIGPKK